MVNSIVHTAIARKMLCSPVNSLIADTEFACAAGMLLRLLKVGKETAEKVGSLATVKELQEWLFEEFKKELEGDFDIRCQNLIAMLKNYRAEEHTFTPQLQELFALGFETEIVYPKGRFL